MALPSPLSILVGGLCLALIVFLTRSGHDPVLPPACKPCKRCAPPLTFPPTSFVQKESACKTRSRGTAEIQKQDTWANVSQEGETDFWMRHIDAMMDRTSKNHFITHYREYFRANGGFDAARDFAGLTVVDVGAGPRPLATAMGGAQVYVIEPLAERFLAVAKKRGADPATGDYLEIQLAEKVFGVPAEAFVPELEGTCDVALSTNSLDHTWDPTTYLENMRRYLKPGGFVYLIVDLHIRTEPMHPQKSLLPSILDQVHAAGLRFERGECILPPAYPGFAFNSCWMVLRKAVLDVDLYEAC